MNSSIRNKNLPFLIFSLLLSPVSFSKQLIPCLRKKAWKRNLNMINYHEIKEKLQQHEKCSAWLRWDRTSGDHVSPTLPWESPGADSPGQGPGEPGEVQGWRFQPRELYWSPSPPKKKHSFPRADYSAKLKLCTESRQSYCYSKEEEPHWCRKSTLV